MARMNWGGIPLRYGAAVLGLVVVGLLTPNLAPADASRRPYLNRTPAVTTTFTLGSGSPSQIHSRTHELAPRTAFPGVIERKAAFHPAVSRPLATLGLYAPLQVAAAAKRPKPYYGLRWDANEPIQTPDCSVAKSPTHSIQTVNSRFTVLDDKGRIVLDDGAGNNFRRLGDLLSGIPGTEDVAWFGPRCAFDLASGRFVLVVGGADFSAQDEAWLAIAVSAGSNPLEGDWTVHGYRTDLLEGGSVSRWPDALDFGMDGTVLTVSWNDHLFGTNAFVHSRLWTFSKSGLFDGTETTHGELSELRDAAGALAFSVKPCRHYGTNDAFYLVSSKPLGAATLELWRLTGTPQSPELTSVSVSDVTNYEVPPNARQPGVALNSAREALETGDCRIQSAVAENNRVWTTLNSSLDGIVPDAAIHIAELDGQAGTAIQSRGIGARGSDYFFAALDTTTGRKPGTVIVFSSSSKSKGVGLRYCTRLHSMAPGLFRPSKPLITGNGRYDPQAPRDPTDPQPPPLWGRYCSAVRDPAKPEQVLIAGPYADVLKSRSSKAWGTRLKVVTP